MNEEMQAILLNGMPLREFIAYYLIAVAGIAFFFLTNLQSAINNDPKTPTTFQWKYFIRGLIRLVLALMSSAAGVIFFSELMAFIMEVPDGAVVEINGFSALLIGIGADGLSKKLVSASIGGYAEIRKQLK